MIASPTSRLACRLVLRMLVVTCPVSVASLLPALGVSAQGPSTPPETGWLSAAINEVRLSPFHATESVLYSGTLPLGIGAANGSPLTMEISSPDWPIRSVAPDSSFSYGKVFYTTWIAAATSNVGAFYLILGYHALPAVATPILGTALGAKVGGARFSPSLVGSAVGLGVVLGMFATGLMVDPDDNFLAFIAIPATVQAGMTTWIASAFH